MGNCVFVDVLLVKNGEVKLKFMNELIFCINGLIGLDNYVLRVYDCW